MKEVQLKEVKHNVKIGDTCGDIEPNVTEASLLMDGKEVVGFYPLMAFKNYH